MSEYSSNWETIQLGNAFLVRRGDSRLTKSAYIRTGFTAYSASGADGFVEDFQNEGEGIVISSVGAQCGKIFRASGKWTAINNTITITNKDSSHCIDYLYHVLDRQDILLPEGGAQPFISQKEVFGATLCLPPLPEQKKIAEILSGIDNAINGSIKKKLNIERTRRALIQQLTRGLNFRGVRKSSGTEFEKIPSHWNCEKLTKCCKLENNKRKPIKAEDRKEMRGKYPYHGATKIQDYISQYSFEGDYTLIGEDGDHFSKYNSWEMAQYATGRFNVSNHAHVIGSTTKCNSRWLYYSMLHRDLTLYLTRQGATRFKLSKASLEEVPVLLPPINEQLKMIKIFDTLTNLINSLENKVTKLSILKKGISSELLTGRKRINI